MGGKALKIYGVETERKGTADFLRIGMEIRDNIAEDFDNKLETEIVTCYHTKIDHGDLDLLLKIDERFHNSGVNLKEYIRDRFEPKAIHNNGGVYSFDYDNFQIDFIPKPSTVDLLCH